LCLVLAVRWLAGAVEDTQSPSAPPRPWWVLRLLPVWICLPMIAHTLMRGQANLVVLALLCGTAAAVLRGRSFQAGCWLAGAICLKVFPAFLLLYPFWRRDGRLLAGCTLGLFVGLALVPAAVFGPGQALAFYQEWAEVLVRPALTPGGDQTRAKELTDITATDSQSLLATLHNTLNLERSTRPRQATFQVRAVALAIGGLLTLVTLLAFGRPWRRDTEPDAPASLLFLGCLTVIMVLLNPVCHLHYFCLLLPLVVGILAASRGSGSVWGWALLFLLYVVANVLPHFPGLEVLRDVGLAMYAALALWLVGVVLLVRGRRAVAAEGRARPALSARAA
jgi:hypothetical protein